MENQQIAEGVIFYMVFLFSATVHEAAHAWVAMLGGDLTAYHGGQVSLNPLPHIRREPFGMVLLPILGIVMIGWPLGYASTPYDPYWAGRHPKRSALMALAGPVSNLLLVVLTGIALRIGAAAGALYAPEVIDFGRVALATKSGSSWEPVAFILGALLSMNLLLALLNLLPLPPLDGSGIVPLVLTERATASYQGFINGNPMLQMVGMLVAWRLINPLFWGVFPKVVNLLYAGQTYY